MRDSASIFAGSDRSHCPVAVSYLDALNGVVDVAVETTIVPYKDTHEATNLAIKFITILNEQMQDLPTQRSTTTQQYQQTLHHDMFVSAVGRITDAIMLLLGKGDRKYQW